MNQDLKIIDEYQELQISLVKYIGEKEMIEIPDKITYNKKDFKISDFITIISKLFYKNGIPVSTTDIVDQYDIEKPDKFIYSMVTNNTKVKALIKYERRHNRYYFYPSAVILIPKKGTLIDTTIYLKHNLEKISEMVEVNICDPPIRLSNLFRLFENKDRIEVVKILTDIVKSQWDIKYDQKILIENISSKLLEMKVTEKTKESFYRIGNLKLPFILWFGTGKRGDEFTYSDITCQYNDIPSEFNDIQYAMGKKITERNKIAKEQGKVFDNHPGYKLAKINLTRELSSEKKDRKIKVFLTFTTTDFYSCVATNLTIDELILEDNKTSIRKKYLRDQNLGDPTYLQNSKLSNMFGIALVTITEDNKILLQKRSQQVSIGPSKLTLATAEHMIRGLDEDESGNPNIFITAKRCLKEEIGIDIEFSNVKFLGFGIRLDNLLPQALGMVKLKLKSSDISFIKARDRWEGFNFTEEFTYDSLEKYFKEHYVISATAKLSILLALINQYGFEHIEEKAKMIPEQIIANI